MATKKQICTAHSEPITYTNVCFACRRRERLYQAVETAIQDSIRAKISHREKQISTLQDEISILKTKLKK